MVHWAKDPALLLQALRSQLWHRFDTWPQNLSLHVMSTTKNNNNNNKTKNKGSVKKKYTHSSRAQRAFLLSSRSKT